MAKRRTQVEILETRLRAGGMAEGDINDVLRTLAAGKPTKPRLAGPVMLTLQEGRPLAVTRGLLDAVFGPGHTTYEFRPYRLKGGQTAARLLPLPLFTVVAPEAAEEAELVPAGVAVEDSWAFPTNGDK